MINKLRFRFIRITMIAVLFVLSLIIIIINVVNISQHTRSLDAITQRLSDNHIVMMQKPDPSDPQSFDFTNFNHGRRFPLQNEKELPYSTRYFSIRLDEDGNIIKSNLKQIASIAESDLKGVTDHILTKNRSIGWYHNYRFRISELPTGSLLVVLESTSTLSSMLYVLFITLIVGIAAFVLIFLLITVFSKRAIAPIVDAYEKQKQFITDASHELKTPLTVISANTEILSLTYGENEWCSGILHQTSSLKDLIEQMIQMAKLDEDHTPMEFTSFDLSEAIYDTAMSFHPLALQRNLQLSLVIDPEIFVLGNEASVRQVTAILMDNAIKYCDPSGQIHVELHSSGRKGPVHATVTNTFSSINTVNTDRLFDRFYRADKARENSHSFGLGLSIARSIMEHHHGSLDCRKASDHQIQFIATFTR